MNSRYLLATTTLLFAGVPVSIPVLAQGVVLEEVVVTARKRAESLQEVPVAVTAFNAEAMESLGIRNMRDIEGLVPGLHLGGGGNGVKGDGNAYIRGVGQRETRVTIDSGVGIYLDDVYIARASGALLDAVEMENIQVLRGPQGTLFGKNTTGGAIIYTSLKPEEGFSGNAKGSFGNLDRSDASLTLNIPLVDDVLLSRFTAATVQRDGFIENVVDGSDFSDEDRNIFTGQLRWLASDTLTLDLGVNYTDTDQRPNGQKCRFLGEELAAQGLTAPGTLESLYNAVSPTTVEENCRASGEELPPDEFRGEQSDQSPPFYDSAYEVETLMLSATANWEINDNLELKSVTAYRNTQQTADEDIDGMDIVLVGRLAGVNNDTDQYSQEFQLSGRTLDDKLSYTTGIYYFYEETNDDFLQDFAGFRDDLTIANTILLSRSNLHERETKNTAYAAFGQMDYNISESWIATLGLRYTWEERKTTYNESRVYLPSIGNGTYLGTLDTIYTANVLHSFTEPGARPVREWLYGFDPDGEGGEPFQIGEFGTLSDDRNDDDWNPMASVKYLADGDTLDALGLDNAMVYLTYATGFRSGGVTVGNGDFDGDQIADLENYKPEFVDMYELGFKIDAFNSKLRANVAAFYQDYDDIQLTTTIPDPNFGIPLPAIENAGKAEIAGIETEFTLLPSDNIRIMGSVAYMDAKYIEYMAEIPNPDGPGQITIDRSDEPMPRAPKWTAFLAVDYFINTDSMGTFIPNFIMRYTDEIYGGFDRESFIVGDEISSPAVTFYDARITWQSPRENATVMLWCKNLMDKDDHLLGGVPTVGVARTTTQAFAAPRTYGVDLTYRFGM